MAQETIQNRRCRVAWRSKKTGRTGHSEWLDEKTAKAWREEADRTAGRDTEHWLEYE